MDEGIVNKVAQSGLIQFDLSKHWPDISSIEYDIAADLWQGIALKEKTFREKLKTEPSNLFAETLSNPHRHPFKTVSSC